MHCSLENSLILPKLRRTRTQHLLLHFATQLIKEGQPSGTSQVLWHVPTKAFKDQIRED